MLSLERIVFARLKTCGEILVRPVLVCRHSCYALVHGTIVRVEETAEHDHCAPSYVDKGPTAMGVLDEAVRHCLDAADALLLADDRLSAALDGEL